MGASNGHTPERPTAPPPRAQPVPALASPHSAPAQPAPRVFVLIPTHTTRHLDTCLASFACHARAADAVVLTCDGDKPEIAALADEVWARVAAKRRAQRLATPPLLHASRPHLGVPRLNQVRNNGLRALDAHFSLRDHDLVLILDGDSILAGDAIEKHARAAAEGHAVIIPFRVNLTEHATLGVGPETFLAPDAGPDTAARLARPQDLDDLAARQIRYERQLRQRARWGWLPAAISPVKRHKPKVIGGHHAVRVDLLRAVNGYDEEFPGEGFDDDDLSQRLYMLRPKVQVAIRVTEILAFHLWHPTRRPYAVTESPSYARFARRDVAMFAARGWQRPLEQPTVSIRLIEPGSPRGAGDPTAMAAASPEMLAPTAATLPGRPDERTPPSRSGPA